MPTLRPIGFLAVQRPLVRRCVPPQVASPRRALRSGFASVFRVVLVAALGAAGLCGKSCWAAEKSASHAAALDSIRIEDLSRHAGALADDALEGREAGTRGGRAAAKYIAEQFGRLGLLGGGVDGGYEQPFGAEMRNVVGVLRGADARLGAEYVVLGAHYDHVGYGTAKTSRGPIGLVHNGADDNASGVAAMLEVAEALTLLPAPPRRSIFFIAFDAEEKGLLGSRHWTAHANPPIDQCAAMVNLDMVGRLRDDRLGVFGARSARGWRRLVGEANQDVALALDFNWMLKDHADHWPFYVAGVPVLMLHTGLHDDYHRPSDDVERLEPAGMSRVGRLTFELVCRLADDPERLAPRSEASSETETMRRRLEAKRAPLPDRLGVSWKPDAPGAHDADEALGVVLARVFPGSPAQRAGLRAGDRVERFAGRDIRRGDDLIGAVRAAVSPATATVVRPGQPEPIELSCELDGKPNPIGLLWRSDAAEPGAAIVTLVIPGTPAAAAGLRAGDRIYRVEGQALADEADAVRRLDGVAGPVELEIEREGRISSARIELPAQSPDDAEPTTPNGRNGAFASHPSRQRSSPAVGSTADRLVTPSSP